MQSIGLFFLSGAFVILLQVGDLFSNNVFSSSQLPKNLSVLEETDFNRLVFSSNVSLVAPYRVMQSFDIDSENNIYYSQIGAANGFVPGKTKAHQLYIIKAQPNDNFSEYMTLTYFGHGSQLAIEEEKEEVYIWIGSNASRYDSGEYWDAQSVSRIQYESGEQYTGHGEDNYFLNKGIYRLGAALSLKGDLICINGTKGGERYFYTYRLSEVKSLPDSVFSIEVRVGGEELGEKTETENRRVSGKNLNTLQPLGFFKIPKGKDPRKDVNTFHYQGFDIDEKGLVYFYEGDGHGTNQAIPHSYAFITVFDKNGNIKQKRRNVRAIEDIDSLVKNGLTNASGYMEAEGIKVKKDAIYLGFASHQKENNYRRANILKYNTRDQ